MLMLSTNVLCCAANQLCQRQSEPKNIMAVFMLYRLHFKISCCTVFATGLKPVLFISDVASFFFPFSFTYLSLRSAKSFIGKRKPILPILSSFYQQFIQDTKFIFKCCQPIFKCCQPKAFISIHRTTRHLNYYLRLLLHKHYVARVIYSRLSSATQLGRYGCLQDWHLYPSIFHQG